MLNTALEPLGATEGLIAAKADRSILGGENFQFVFAAEKLCGGRSGSTMLSGFPGSSLQAVLTMMLALPCFTWQEQTSLKDACHQLSSKRKDSSPFL